MNEERVHEDGLPRWTAPRAAPRHGDDWVGWTAAFVLVAIAALVNGIVVVLNVSMASHPAEYPRVRDADPVVVGSLVPLAAVLAYWFWRQRPDRRPAVLLRRWAVTMIVIGSPLLWYTFGMALSGLGG